jgi:signal transduction histidine kinase
MLSRRHSFRSRLLRTFGLFSSMLMLITWLGSIAYFFWSERNDLRQTLQAQAAMLATQSAAPVMFGDSAVLKETLAVLRHMEHLRWMVVNRSAPDASPSAPKLRLAEFGSPPADLTPYLARLAATGGMVETLSEMTVRLPIEHDGVVRGELIVNLDLGSELARFVFIMSASAILNFLFFLAALVVFSRVVRTLVDPVETLVAVVDKVKLEGNSAARAVVEFDDEIARLGQAMNDMLDTISAREQDLARSRNQLRALSRELQDAREAERTRIAHEVHDQLGQGLTALKFQMSRELAAEPAAALGRKVDEIIDKVRTISWELRPSVLDSLGLGAAIEWLAGDFQQQLGIRIRCEVPDRMIAADERATDLFRICQELLTNVARHARASAVHVRLRQEAGALQLEVEDDGVGIPSQAVGSRSLGLLGVSERCARWGGAMTSGPGRDQGACVRVTLPSAGPVDMESTPRL